MNIVKNHYADFTGRARRSEYWYFVLAQLLLLIGVIVLGGILGMVSETLGSLVGGLGYAIVAFGLLVPSLAVAVRRLHDTGKSGWFLLLALIPIGNIVVLVFMCLDSEPGANQYGPNPKTGVGYAGTGEDNLGRHLVD